MNELLMKSLNTGMDMKNAMLAVVISFFLGLVIMSVYKNTSTGFSRSSSMSFTYLLVTIIITSILISLGNNIALSLGLIGSLSVIRFRTPVKDPEDMAYLFWAIATGLATGSGNFIFAVFLVVFLGVVIFFFSRQALSKFVSYGHVLVLESGNKTPATDEIYNIFTENKLKWQLKSSLFDKDAHRSEIVFELDQTKKVGHVYNAVKAIQELPWVNKVSLLSSDSYSVI